MLLRRVVVVELRWRLAREHGDEVVEVILPARTELADHLYDFGHERDTNAIEVIVARLRRKLGVDLIETRRGFGYLVPAGSA